jgi:hypothetical protein
LFLAVLPRWLSRVSLNLLGPKCGGRYRLTRSIGRFDRKDVIVDGQYASGEVESGPIPPVHGVVRWRVIDLCQWVWDEFEISVSPQTMSRELRGLGYRKLSARPRHHAQAAGAIEDFKKLARDAGGGRARARLRSRRHRGLVR